MMHNSTAEIISVKMSKMQTDNTWKWVESV